MRCLTVALPNRRYNCLFHIMLSAASHMQCIARDVDGKREVAGVHWDYDCYGAPGKMAQVCLSEGTAYGDECSLAEMPIQVRL